MSVIAWIVIAVGVFFIFVSLVLMAILKAGSDADDQVEALGWEKGLKKDDMES